MVVSRMISFISLLCVTTFAQSENFSAHNNKSTSAPLGSTQNKKAKGITSEEFIASLGLVQDIKQDTSDKNENGIRDDVDLYLSLTVESPSKEADLAYLYAFYLQQLLESNSTQADDLFFPYLNTLHALMCFADKTILNDIEILMTDSLEVFSRKIDKEEIVHHSRYRYWTNEISCYYAPGENMNNLPYHEFIESKKYQLIEQTRQQGIQWAKRQGIYNSVASKFEP